MFNVSSRYLERCRLFIGEAKAFLSTHEDVNAVILGIERIAGSDTPDSSENFFGLAYDGNTPVAAAFRTPPYGVSVSRGPDAAMITGRRRPQTI